MGEDKPNTHESVKGGREEGEWGKTQEGDSRVKGSRFGIQVKQIMKKGRGQRMRVEQGEVQGGGARDIGTEGA